MKKVAVTGAGGKVGRQVIQELIDNKYEVISLTHSPKNVQGKEVSLDIKNYSKVEKALQGCDAVIHLAAIASPINSDDSLVMETNVMGTYNIMRAAGENDIQRLALASSDCTLGFTFSVNPSQPEYLPVDEEHPLNPDDSYGLSKVLMERAAEAMVQRYSGMSIASLRISHVTNPEEYQGKNSNFLKWAQNPEKGPWNLWSYIDNRDAARAFRKAIETNLNGHEEFFIAADNTRCEVPTKKLIRKYFPEVEVKKELDKFESLESTLKARKMLDFKPRYKWNDN